MTESRQTGSETVPCPTCGANLPVLESVYGSTTAGTCQACYGGASQKASAPALPREVGTDVAPDLHVVDPEV